MGTEIAERIQSVPPQHAALLPSEMLAFCQWCQEQSVETVVESGRRFGYSTECLAQFDWQVVSIETTPEPDYDARLAQYPNVALVRGDGSTVGSYISGRTAILMDGPKGLVALRIVRKLLPKIVLAGIHDAYRGTPIRDELDGAWFTDDPEHLKRYGCLDTDSLRYRGYEEHGALLSVGNVLALMRGGKWTDQL